MAGDIAELGFKIDSAPLDRSEKSLNRHTAASKRTEQAAQSLGVTATGASRRVVAANDNMARSTKAVTAGFTAAKGALVAFVAAAASLAVATAFFRKFIENTKAAQAEQAALAAAIRSTNHAAGQSVDSLNRHAAALQLVTKFGDETINGAQKILLTFTKIQGDVFPKATEAVLNVATVMGQDLRSAAVQVGKALNDPVQGINALSRSGITFSDAQKKVVKELVATGQIIAAQTLILKELESQFGGAARAARDTLGGALAALSNAWGDLFELGKGQTTGLQAAIESLTKAISDPAFAQFVNLVGVGLVQAFTFVIEVINSLVSAYNAAANTVTSVTSEMASHVSNAWQSVANWIKTTFGVDINQVVRSTVNATIQALVIMGENVKFAFSNIGNIVGGAIIGAANVVLDKVKAMVNSVIGAINTLITGLNKIPKVNIPTISEFQGKTISNPYADALSTANVERRKRISEISQTDYVGKLFPEQFTSSDLNVAQVEKTTKALEKAGNAAKKAGAANKKAGDDGAKAWDAYEKKIAKAEEQVRKFWRDTAVGFFKDIRSGLEQGKSLWQAFADAALKALDRIIDKITGELFDALFNVNQSKSGGGIIGSIFNLGKSLFGGGSSSGFADLTFDVPGFNKGGYTGGRGRNQIAGVVHGQEFVMNATATRRHRGMLERLNAGAGPQLMPMQSGASVAPVEITIQSVNDHPTAKVERRQQRSGDGKKILIREVITEVNKSIDKGEMDGSLRNRMNLFPRGVIA